MLVFRRVNLSILTIPLTAVHLWFTKGVLWIANIPSIGESWKKTCDETTWNLNCNLKSSKRFHFHSQPISNLWKNRSQRWALISHPKHLTQSKGSWPRSVATRAFGESLRYDVRRITFKMMDHDNLRVKRKTGSFASINVQWAFIWNMLEQCWNHTDVRISKVK